MKTEASSHDLLVRIEQLERRSRFERRALALVGTSLLAACTLAAGTALTDAKFETVTCTRLVLVDAEGRARFEANSSADGTAGIRLLDANGRMRIGASTTSDGACTQSFSDPSGEMRVILGSLGNGYSGLNIFSAEGKPAVEASTTQDGGVTLSRADSAPAAPRASSLEEARRALGLAKAALEAEEKRVSTIRAYQHQTSGIAAATGHSWANAPEVDRAVLARYHAALARYRELGGR
jgi:hypothetical protein